MITFRVSMPCLLWRCLCWVMVMWDGVWWLLLPAPGSVRAPWAASLDGGGINISVFTWFLKFGRNNLFLGGLMGAKCPFM